MKHFLETLVLVAAAVGVWVQLRGIQNQLWLQMFTEYTRRYSEVMAGIPFEASGIGAPAELSTLEEDQRKAVIGGMRRYFNLCSEEFYLHQKERVDGETWGIWQSGIQASTRGPFFASSWRYLRAEYRFYPAFSKLIDGVIANADTGESGKSASTPSAAEGFSPNTVQLSHCCSPWRKPPGLESRLSSRLFKGRDDSRPGRRGRLRHGPV
jgi:hypothetical protein